MIEKKLIARIFDRMEPKLAEKVLSQGLSREKNHCMPVEICIYLSDLIG